MYLVTRPGPRLDLAAVYVEKYVHQVNFYSGSILLALLRPSNILKYVFVLRCPKSLPDRHDHEYNNEHVLFRSAIMTIDQWGANYE